MCRPINTST